MPKKTLKQKMHTDRQVESYILNKDETYSTTAVGSRILTKNVTSTIAPYLRKDLTKTLLLGVLFVIFEILLSFVIN